MTEKNEPVQIVQVKATAPADKEFPELKTLTYMEMYDLVAKFIQKAVPIKGATLTVIKGLGNRVSMPKPPYVVLQVIADNRISGNETRYTDKYKILWNRSEITMNMEFAGTGNIPALQMASAFAVRFNDAWASEQFEQYDEPFFPLYSDEVRVLSNFVNAENQYEDACSVDVYFEHHSEFGVSANSAKEIIMNVNKVDE